MRRFLQFAILGLLALLAILFAVNNRDMTLINMAPLPWQVEIPVYLLVMISLVLGVLLGGVANWLSAGTTRKELRQTKRELGKELDKQSRPAAPENT